MQRPNLAVLILTFNERLHIERAIRAVAPIAREIFVIDSGSTDGTVEIAERLGATVHHHEFVNQARQFQWGLENAPISADWIIRLDADEVIEPDLAEEIARRLPTLPPEIVGVTLDRKHIFMDRWIRRGGRYPLRLLRIWRRGHGRIEDRWMDEHMIVWGGSTVTFKGGFSDHNLNDLTYFIDKHNRYATREAIDVLIRKYGLLPTDDGLHSAASPGQAKWKRWIKEGIYNRLPFELSTLAYFLWRYFGQLGFLDGRPGLVYHFLQGYWYRFLVGAKVAELESQIVPVESPSVALSRLEKLTGYPLTRQSSARSDASDGRAS